MKKETKNKDLQFTKLPVSVSLLITDIEYRQLIKRLYMYPKKQKFKKR